MVFRHVGFIQELDIDIWCFMGWSWEFRRHWHLGTSKVHLVLQNHEQGCDCLGKGKGLTREENVHRVSKGSSTPGAERGEEIVKGNQKELNLGTETEGQAQIGTRRQDQVRSWGSPTRSGGECW